ncbi:hypothetical protein HG530_012270 [Fusarium avenaceum]|nr:hypothetical protein DER45DRAFT_618505 [Fusarium avenaceum]KAI6754518.1 hypothetical protein HG530_012270 [Fusarium avenaceum]
MALKNLCPSFLLLRLLPSELVSMSEFFSDQTSAPVAEPSSEPTPSFDFENTSFDEDRLSTTSSDKAVMIKKADEDIANSKLSDILKDYKTMRVSV